MGYRKPQPTGKSDDPLDTVLEGGEARSKMAEFWYRVADKLGIATFVLFVVLLFLALGARWVATEVIKPVTERHLRFVDTADEVLRTQARQQSEMTTAVRLQAEAMEDQSQTLGEIKELLQERMP